MNPLTSNAPDVNENPGSATQIAAFYLFVHLPDPATLQGKLQQRAEDLGLTGTILLAEEGINGTIAGPERGLSRFFERLKEDQRFAAISVKHSMAKSHPFHRMKVRIKKEIVSLGVPEIDPANRAGEYVDPADWNDLISRDDVRVIDTRNRYEVELGSFRGAESPETDSFREFPDWVANHLDRERDRNVAMFCTGGIRCEKATAYLLQQGFENVYHLDGGILNYLEKQPPDNSLWEGDCFVFDNRVSVDHSLTPGDFEVCPACRMPLTEADREAPEFERNVSCPRCFHRLTPEKREGLLERARQMALAEQRGEKHLGRKEPTESG